MSKKSNKMYTLTSYEGLFGNYKSLRILLHIIASVQFCYAIYYDYTYVHFPLSDSNMHNPFGGKFKFLTFLDAIIQAIYFIIAVLNDVLGTNEVVPKKVFTLRKLRDYIFATLAFPIALTVGISFWSLYAIDRELVFPQILDAVFPSWLNHVMHTNIVIFSFLEIFVSFRIYPARNMGITLLAIFMASYLVWIHIVKHYSGVWVYPVLEVMQFPQRVVFFFAILTFTLCLYMFGEFINNIIWAKQLRQLNRKIK